MREYCYAFVLGDSTYYVYAPSKEEAKRMYLCEHSISELPKGMTIDRFNI